MPATRVSAIDAIETSVQKTNHWINEISDELKVEKHDAYRILRAYLHTIRDRLNVDENAQLAAQLPMVVRGIYFEGWSPRKGPEKLKAEEFIEIFSARADLPDEVVAEDALRSCTQLLRRHASEGETEDVLSTMPKDLRRVLE